MIRKAIFADPDAAEYIDDELHQADEYGLMTVGWIQTTARSMYKKPGCQDISIVPTVFNGLPDVNFVLPEKWPGD